MPIYEYRCDSCGFQKEHLQKMSDAPLDICPACNQRSYLKLISAAGFHLKGTGWYATDFKGGTAPAATTTTSTPAETSSAPAAGCGGACACHPG
jgi:putative FmdB family regulatory protein